MRPIQNQRGSTLLVALIMLVMMTLMAVSAMSTTTANIQVVGNAQFQEEAAAAGQRALENVLSTRDFLTVPQVAQNIDINLDGVADYVVTFDPPPRCVSYLTANPANSPVPLPLECSAGAGLGVSCYWTVWDITANVSDATTGANVVIHQGVRTIAGLNAAVAFCGI